MATAKAQKFSCEDPDVLWLAKDQLASSGLSLEYAAQVGIDVLSKEQMAELGYKHDQAGILFRYWDPESNDYSPTTQFHRVRLLGTASGFSAQSAKPIRYLQPSGTLNQIYLPRIVDGKLFDWSRFLAGTEPIIITEGEKKAILACKMGIPCLALGGVDMWRASKRGVEVLPLLSKTNFRDRDVYVVFDTDTATGLKADVMASAQRLMDYLAMQGATPQLAILPPAVDGTKVALDDYLQDHTLQELRELVLENAVPHGSALKLCEFSKRFVYVKSVGRFMVLDSVEGSSDLALTRDRLDEALGMAKIGVPVLTSIRQQGAPPILRPTLTPTTIANALLMFGGLTKCRNVTYSPGKPKLVEIAGGFNYNLWDGWCCEYEDDTCELPEQKRRIDILNLWDWALDNLFADEPAAREFIDHWILYPILYPGTKLNTLVLLTSIKQGIGKTFIGDMLGKFVYGFKDSTGPKHASKIVEGRLDESFNSYMYAKSFILGDDIAAQHKNGVYKRIMSFVTSEDIEINIKNVPQFTIENCANFWLTSNDPAPFFLTDNDRRALVHIPRKAVKSTEKYDKLKAYFVSGEAGPTLLWFARERYYSGKFNPQQEAPWTSAKSEVVVNSKGQLRDWIEGLLASAAGGELTRPAATTREIMALLELDDSRLYERANDRGVGLMLAESGALYYSGGEQILIRNNSNGTSRRERVWVLGSPLEMTALSKHEMSNFISTTPFRHEAKNTETNVVRIKKPKF